MSIHVDKFKKLIPFWKNVAYKLNKIKLEDYERVNFNLDNDTNKCINFFEVRFLLRLELHKKANLEKVNTLVCIALIELEQPFELGKVILPSCLLKMAKKTFL